MVNSPLFVRFFSILYFLKCFYSRNITPSYSFTVSGTWSNFTTTLLYLQSHNQAVPRDRNISRVLRSV